MIKKDYPLISCLCITKEKPDLLFRAIICFINQTYPSKELIIVYEDNDLATKKMIANINHNNIFFYEIKNSKDITLGHLRNYAVKQSHGDYICQWDDDDWYHINRIEYQYNQICITGLPACVMTKWLVFDGTKNKAYISNERLWEGSLLCHNDTIRDLKYANYDRGEDTIVIEQLQMEKKISFLSDKPYLYIYIYHGKNTWDYNHWNKIFKKSMMLDSSNSFRIKSIIQNNEKTVENSLEITSIFESSK